jgi:transcriptional regulator with XRE-family HTH domain
MKSPREMKHARLSGGFKLREVGDKVSVEASTIAAYEIGRANPSPGAAARWQEALEQLLSERRAQIDRALNSFHNEEGQA